MTEDDGKVTVRTTFFPDRELKVTPEEALDLKRQGFLKDEKATAPAARVKGEKA